MRPSWKLHLWHYVWALENWLEIEKIENIKCNFLIADYQVLWDYIWETEKIRASVLDVVLDWLAVWLDPEKSKFVTQSYIPEFAELALYLSMFTPVSLLKNNPTLKAEMKQLEQGWKSNISVWFFNYPVSQAADILLPKSDIVPVWEDQIPHIELARNIISRVNKIYGTEYPLPKALIWKVWRLVGVDWQAKMSKSLWNAIMLSDEKDEIKKKVMKMYTDPTRIRATDPWHIEWNVVFLYLDIFHKDKEELESLKELYRNWKIWDVAIKQMLLEDIENFIYPIRERRKIFENDISKVREIIESWAESFRDEAKEFMISLRESMWVINY